MLHLCGYGKTGCKKKDSELSHESRGADSRRARSAKSPRLAGAGSTGIFKPSKRPTTTKKPPGASRTPGKSFAPTYGAKRMAKQVSAAGLLPVHHRRVARVMRENMPNSRIRRGFPPECYRWQKRLGYKVTDLRLASTASNREFPADGSVRQLVTGITSSRAPVDGCISSPPGSLQQRDTRPSFLDERRYRSRDQNRQ